MYAYYLYVYLIYIVYSIIIYIYYNTQKDILFIREDWNAKVGSQ